MVKSHTQEHDVLGTAPSAGWPRRGGSRILLHGKLPKHRVLWCRTVGQSVPRVPPAPQQWWKMWIQLLMTTSSRTEELGDDVTAEVPPEWLILPHTREFCVQNSLNQDSGSTSLTRSHSAPALSPSAGSCLKGDGRRAPKHTVLHRTTSPRYSLSSVST